MARGGDLDNRRNDAANGDIALEARAVSREFGGFFAVRDVDLKVRHNTIHALIGPNGAGKTTLFNLLTKFLPPSAGRILCDGEDITAAAPDAIARRGMVRSFQISAAYGQKRALELATTLALEPRILLLDEPMAGLGQEDIGRISALIRRIAAERTVLMVEHNLNVVADLSDTITVLARGQVLAEGGYAEVARDPRVIEAYMGSAGSDGSTGGSHD